ncbi:MAG: HD domain-containing protein [Lachnospiraceae bacterium]|nr:HD domain-containing protein [Lachnospiraceae bacterium]
MDIEEIEKRYKKLISYLDIVEDEDYRKLLKFFFVDDEDFIYKFKTQHAGARTHHSYVGGLLEHTLGVMQICDFIWHQYSIIDRDLLITTAALHDIGKVEEISLGVEKEYTDEGQLIGHIIIGYEMVCKKINMMKNFSVRRKNEIRHCILAHHGQHIYGSPQEPALIEALILSLADLLDAKVSLMSEVLKNDSEDELWLGYNEFFGRNISKTSTYRMNKNEERDIRTV